MGAATLLSAFALATGITGCSMASQVRPVGENLYAVSGRATGGETTILLSQHGAYEAAQAFCEEPEMRLLPTGSQVQPEAYTLRFRCVKGHLNNLPASVDPPEDAN